MKYRLLGGLCTLILLLTGCQSKQQFELSGFTMGSTYRIKYVANQAIDKSDIESILKEVDKIFSTYNEESWLAEFNRLSANTCLNYPTSSLENNPLKTVLNESLYWANLTNGRYDPTIKPLTDLWGFGANKHTQIPDIDSRVQAAQLVNFRALQVGSEQLCKTDVAVQLDLNSIVAGYAVDTLGQYLEKHHIDNYLVDVTGEIKIKGHHIDGSYWTVAIEAPNENQPQAVQLIQMDDVVLSSSGDYRNYFMVNGVRYSHTVDPNTLAPITHSLASVGVLAKTAMRADALSTLLMVLGPEKGLEFATEHGIAAVFITRQTDNQFVSTRSPAFNRILNNKDINP